MSMQGASAASAAASPAVARASTSGRAVTQLVALPPRPHGRGQLLIEPASQPSQDQRFNQQSASVPIAVGFGVRQQQPQQQPQGGAAADEQSDPQPEEEGLMVSYPPSWEQKSEARTLGPRNANIRPAGEVTLLRSRHQRMTHALRSSAKTGVFNTRMGTDFGITTSAGGTIYVATGLYANVVSLGEFTDFINVFDEFKVKSVKYHFIPFSPTKTESLINSNGRSLVIAYDSNDAIVPTGMSTLWAGNDTAHCFSNMYPRSFSWQVLSSQPAVWFSTLSATAPLYPGGSIKIAGDANLGTSTPCGQLFVEYFVSFRSRR